MKTAIAAFGLTALLVASSALAQQPQPGSAAYNSVYLPAHGAGDTKRSNAVRWGALARTEKGSLGWTVDGGSEEEATAQALKECTSNSGEKCSIVFTFYNGCAAFAAGSEASTWSSAGGKSLAWHRQAALRECGSGCTIRRDGCAFPGK
jgi:hypothetical protein